MDLQDFSSFFELVATFNFALAVAGAYDVSLEKYLGPEDEQLEKRQNKLEVDLQGLSSEISQLEVKDREELSRKYFEINNTYREKTADYNKALKEDISIGGVSIISMGGALYCLAVLVFSGTQKMHIEPFYNALFILNAVVIIITLLTIRKDCKKPEKIKQLSRVIPFFAIIIYMAVLALCTLGTWFLWGKIYLGLSSSWQDWAIGSCILVPSLHIPIYATKFWW
jgi:hypothetical protein